MIEVETIKVALPLKKKFKVSGGEADNKVNLITILNNRYSGEAAASVHYGPSLEEIEADIRKGIERLKEHPALGVDALDAIGGYDIDPIAKSALVGMVLNYLSGESRRYPWEIVSLGAPVGIKNSITISIADPADVLESIRASEFSIVKVKMGGEYDAELIHALQEKPDKEIRVDANGGWSPEKAEEFIHHLANLGIKIIEQPTDSEHVADWPHLKGKHEDVVLILDEGLNTVADYDAMAANVDGINVKMEKSGGIIEAARLARKAREDGKKVMLGCMVESSIGIAQSVYMSSLADYHDLDAPQLLETDIAQGIVYDKDTIHVDREIIGGPALKRDIIEKFIRD
jgi:L-alanine-DL-glutamate epimerase-like enolase superfamily enzyme